MQRMQNWALANTPLESDTNYRTSARQHNPSTEQASNNGRRHCWAAQMGARTRRSATVAAMEAKPVAGMPTGRSL